MKELLQKIYELILVRYNALTKSFLNLNLRSDTLMEKAIIKRLTASTCAIGHTRVPFEDFKADQVSDPLRIIGTGFLVQSDIVMTNRHVFEELKRNQLPDDNCYLWFVYPERSGRLQSTYLPPLRWRWASSPW